MLTITGKTTLHIKEQENKKGEKYQSIQICLAKDNEQGKTEYAYVPVILSNKAKAQIALDKLKIADKIKIEVDVIKGWLTFSKSKDDKADTIKIFINEIK
jgi:hypothetical protein